MAGHPWVTGDFRLTGDLQGLKNSFQVDQEDMRPNIIQYAIGNILFHANVKQKNKGFLKSAEKIQDERVDQRVASSPLISCWISSALV